MLRTRWTPSPCDRLSRPRTTTGPPSHPDGIDRRRVFPLTSRPLARKGAAGMVPTFTLEPSTGSAPNYAPATSPRLRRRPSPWPPGRRHRPRSPPHQSCGCALLSSPYLPGLELVDRLRGFQPLVSHVRLSVSLAGPGPSGSAGPSRRCQGGFPPSPSSQGSGCPQLLSVRCDGPTAVSFHHGGCKRASGRTSASIHK